MQMTLYNKIRVDQLGDALHQRPVKDLILSRFVLFCNMFFLLLLVTVSGTNKIEKIKVLLRLAYMCVCVLTTVNLY